MPSGLRPIGRGRSARNAEIPVRIRRAGPVSRGGGRAAKAPDCLSGPGGFDSLPSRQFSRVSWGSAVRCGRPPRAALFQIPGAKLIRMSRRLLTVRQSVRFAPHPPGLFWGSKAAMRPIVNREMRRFESCPQSHFRRRSGRRHAGQLRWSRRLVLQTSTVEFDPQARHQVQGAMPRWRGTGPLIRPGSVRARPLPPMPGASSKGSGHRSSKPGMAVRVCPRPQVT